MFLGEGSRDRACNSISPPDIVLVCVKLRYKWKMWDFTGSSNKKKFSLWDHFLTPIGLQCPLCFHLYLLSTKITGIERSRFLSLSQNLHIFSNFPWSVCISINLEFPHVNTHLYEPKCFVHGAVSVILDCGIDSLPAGLHWLCTYLSWWREKVRALLVD